MLKRQMNNLLFWLFRKVCKKNHCKYAINDVNGLVLTMKPTYNFDNIECRANSYFTLFITAIKTIKDYNKTYNR